MHSGLVPKTKSILGLAIAFLRLGLLSAIYISIIAPAQGNAFYQINSEVINIPSIGGIQADLKLLVGKEFLTASRVALGIHSLYQSADDPSYYTRYGPMLQFRKRLFVDNLYLYYEHHEFQLKTSFSEATNSTSNRLNSENRYGIVYSRYDQIVENWVLDTYGESFLIPQVSSSDLLSVVRSTLLYKKTQISPLVEVYLKDSPQNFGGDNQDLRVGLQWQPFSFTNLKVMTNVLSKSDASNSGVLGQFNIFYDGAL